MKSRLFDPKSPIAKTFVILFDVFTLSILWFLTSIFVFTTGLGYSGLFYAIDRSIFNDDEKTITNYIKSIRTNLKQGIIVDIIVLIILLSIMWSMYISYQMASSEVLMGKVIFAFGCVILFLFLGYISFLFSTLALYEYRTKDLFDTCFKLSIMHLPVTIVLALLLAVSIYICYHYWVCLFFIPALLVIIQLFLLKKVYRKHSDC